MKSVINHPAAQAGIEKTVFDEITRGLNYAAQALTTEDDQEHFRLLGEAENSYHNAVYLIDQTSVLPGSSTIRRLGDLQEILKINQLLTEGN